MFQNFAVWKEFYLLVNGTSIPTQPVKYHAEQKKYSAFTENSALFYPFSTKEIANLSQLVNVALQNSTHVGNPEYNRCGRREKERKSSKKLAWFFPTS